jgi:hypothetical protein
MFTRIYPKNVHEMSTKCHQKNVHEKSPKKRTFRGQKCPRDVAKSVHEMSPFLSTKCHLLCPRNVCHLNMAIFSIHTCVFSNGVQVTGPTQTFVHGRSVLLKVGSYLQLAKSILHVASLEPLNQLNFSNASLKPGQESFRVTLWLIITCPVEKIVAYIALFSGE